MSFKLSIGGCVFDDVDANGIVLAKDENGNYTNEEEPGLGGVIVRVVDVDGNPVSFLNAVGEAVSSTTSDSRGFYKIFGLQEGTAYRVQFDYSSLPNASDLSLSPANVVEPAFIGQGGSEGKDSDAVRTLSAGVVETDPVIAGSTASNKVNLGLVKEDEPTDPGNALLGNQLFEDANRNGQFDRGEIGIAGVGVTLTGAGADGVFGTTDDISKSTVTRSGGFYDFRNLNAGDYKVTFETPDGFEFTTANAAGVSEGRDSDADETTGMTDVISLAASERNFKVDAGVVRADEENPDPMDALLGNKVFEDANRNGRQDVGEIGVGGVEVILTGAGADGILGTDDDISATTTTNSSGFYRFNQLKAGDYKVTFGTVDGFEFTTANVGSDSGDSDADQSTGMTDVISLAESERNYKVDAGLVQVSEPNEAPNAGDDTGMTDFNIPVAINVLGNDSDSDGDALSVTSLNGQAVTVGQSVATENGSVQLLANGQLSFTPNDGFSGVEVFSYHVSDGKGGEDTANVEVTVKDPVVVDPMNALLGNQVFEDANANGLRDNGEVGVGGVNVTLAGAGADGVFGTGDDISATTTTSSAGFYRFNKLKAGDYKVTFDQPEGFEFTTANVGSNEGKDSDADQATGMTDVITLAASERNFKVDAGLVRTMPPNNAPNASNDSERTAFETAVNVNVLDNDTDPDGDTLSVTSIAGQSVTVGQTVDVGNGSATLLNNGQIRFNPDAGFSGNETFSYHVSDGEGGEDTANVSVTVDPRPRKDIKASIVGASGIHEGNSAFYKVQLDEAVTEDTIFTLDVHNGSAERVDRNDYQAAHQDIMWGGYYSVGYVDRYGNWTRLAYYVDNRVANGTSLSSGDRPQIGPDGYTIWDYTVEKNGHVQNGGKVNVLVRAGQTMSDQFEVQTWKEKVTVDRAPWSVSTGYYEGTENFSIKLTGTSGNAADDISLGNNKSVNIFDKTHYDFVSPLALDLNGDGVQTVAFGATEGTFDLQGNGNAIESGWLSSEDAFLAVDTNGNGQIDDISELFGGDVGEGFAKLATYDTNNDGVVDSEEILGGGILLWQDANSNHSTDSGELMSLASQGIESLDTAFVETPVYQNGNVLIEHGSATKVDGSKIDLVDAYFQVTGVSTAANIVEETTLL